MSPTDTERPPLTTRTALVDIRAQELHAEVRAIHLPDSIRMAFEPKPPEAKIFGQHLYIRFRHVVHFLDVGRAGDGDADERTGIKRKAGPEAERNGTARAQPLETQEDSGEVYPEVGVVSVCHVVELNFDGERPSDDELVEMVATDTLKVVYPYVRADIQRCASSVGLPSALLPFLRGPLEKRRHSAPDR